MSDALQQRADEIAAADRAEWCPWFCEIGDGPDGELVYCDRPVGHDDQHYHPEAYRSEAGWELDWGAA